MTQLRNKDSDVSIHSQFSISSIATATRALLSKAGRSNLRHSQSMPFRRSTGSISSIDSQSEIKSKISAPVTGTAVDMARGRYMKDTVSDPTKYISLSALASTMVPMSSIMNEDDDSDPTCVFEPRPTNTQSLTGRSNAAADSIKENIFEPNSSSNHFVLEAQRRRQVPLPAWSRPNLSIVTSDSMEDSDISRSPKWNRARASSIRKRPSCCLETLVWPLSTVHEELGMPHTLTPSRAVELNYERKLLFE